MWRPCPLGPVALEGQRLLRPAAHTWSTGSGCHRTVVSGSAPALWDSDNELRLLPRDW